MDSERIIAIETSSRRGSVALGEGSVVRSSTAFSADARHASELLPAIERLCAEAGWGRRTIGQVHVSIGPGSFTGLRVAVTTARHLAMGLGARVVAVPSLAVIADNARLMDEPPARVAVILDAKRGQVFAGMFELRDEWYEACGAAALVEPGAWLSGLPRPVAVMGEGVRYHLAAVEATGLDVLDEGVWLPRAESVLRLGWRMAERGQFAAYREVTPLYVRRPEAEEIWERRQAEVAGQAGTAD